MEVVGGRGRGGEVRGAKVVHTDIHTNRHTYKQTYRPSDEAGPRGAFAPKKMPSTLHLYLLIKKGK